MLANLSGKVALCVGATSGIGRGVATRLAMLNASVAVAARNKEEGLKLIDELKAINPQGKHDFIPCEATSMRSITEACNEFSQRHDKLNFLVMTQGKASLDPRTETDEGIDKKMALNYYGRIHCINSLESLLKKTAAAASEDVRVLSVLGVLYPHINLNDLALKTNYSVSISARTAGFYTDVAFDQLSRNYGNHRVSFVHASPGGVRSNFNKNLPFPLNHTNKLLELLNIGVTPEAAAEILVDQGLLGAHMGPTADGRAGFHLMNSKGQEGKRTDIHTDVHREAVWRHTGETLRTAHELQTK